MADTWKALIIQWNGKTISPIPVNVVQRLSPTQALIIECDDIPKSILQVQDNKATIILDSGTAEIDVGLASYSMNEYMHKGRIKGTLMPKWTPCDGEQPDTLVTRAICDLYCFPRFYGLPFHEVRLPASTKVTFAGKIEGNVGRLHISALPKDDLEAREARSKETGGIYASHSLEITHAAGEDEVFSVRDLNVVLRYLRAFLSFVRGQDIGMSTVTAFNSHTQQRMIARWGMEHVQPFTYRGMLLSPTRDTGSAMAKMFTGYYNCVSGTDGDVILQAIDSYVCASQTSFVLSVPIIQSALEGLVGLSYAPNKWRKLGGFGAALESELNDHAIPCDIPHNLRSLENSHPANYSRAVLMRL